MGWGSSRMTVCEVGTGLRMLAPGPVTVKKTNLLGVGKNVLTPKGILEWNFLLCFLYHYGGPVFREMRCSRAENHFVLPFLEKGQSLIIMIPHRKRKWPCWNHRSLEPAYWDTPGTREHWRTLSGECRAKHITATEQKRIRTEQMAICELLKL